MTRRYDAFLVRYRHLDGGAQRVEVAHIQSAERALVTSLAAAPAWIAAAAARWPTSRLRPAAQGRGGAARGKENHD